MTTHYAMLQEDNESEGETWFVLLPLDGNEDALDVLAAGIAAYREAVGDNAAYDLDLSACVPESVAHFLVNLDIGSYMPMFSKAVGELVLPDPLPDPDDPEGWDDLLYKARIHELFKDFDQ